MYEFGQGVVQDYTTALAWYRQAAERNFAPAQNNIGILLLYGQGAQQDYAEAVVWFRLAAEQGNAKAQVNLGKMYAVGNGVPRNNVTAYMWADIASANGHENGAILRDSILTPRMASDQIAEAQRRVLVCIVSSYQECD